MAQHEADREDLLAEIAALSPRAELTLVGDEAAPIVAGFRREGFLSIYFTPEFVLHFDAAGELRRAYLAGHLYRTQGTTLARLTRSRTPSETQLLRYDLAPGELQELLARLQQRLQLFLEQLATQQLQVGRQVPAETTDFLTTLRQAVVAVLHSGIRLAPPITRRR